MVIIPVIMKGDVKVGMVHLLVVLETGAIVCMGHRDVVVDKEIEVLVHQWAKITSLMFNIANLEYNLVEGQRNAAIGQQ